ncbi:MAG: putative alanine aminopeptidase [Frankiales bacterium]|nr:putative alanine aminopeptidase [Frankiales bacterium]
MTSPVASPRATGFPSCTTYRAADPRRPVLTADVTVRGRKVAGTERIVFTPDLAVGQLVFRLWAAAPVPSRYGGRQAVTSVEVNGAPRASTRPSPTVLRIPWSGPAGTPVTIELGFTLTLPVGADERWGNRGSTSWFASGMPLLAWESGHGWDVEPATTQFAEASTSEEMRLDRLTVHHAAGLTVLATGGTMSRTATTLVTSAPSVRDVAVAVGRFRIALVNGPVPVTVGVTPGLADDPAEIARETAAYLRGHIARFGPFPYQHVVIAVLPDISGGIEYPGAILLSTRQDKDATLSHELGHQWFYGLVGDDQARDPWLDEAFATYSEALERGTASSYTSVLRLPRSVRGKTGLPMTYWEGRPGYYQGVYVQGAGALLRARARDPRRFDAQLRCYIAHNAHRIATPADVARDLPLAVAELRRVGALRG